MRKILNLFGPIGKKFNWPFCVTGVISGAVGARLWSGSQDQHWLSGALFQALSLFLIWKAFPNRDSRLPEARESFSPKPPKKKGKSRLSWNDLFPLGSVLLFSVIGQLFFSFRLTILALASWGVALFMFSQLPKAGPAKTWTPGPVAEKKLLALVLLAAALMRFPFIGQHITGLQIDESNCICDAYSFLDGSLNSPFVTSWGGNESFHFWWLSMFMRIFGATWVTARLFSAVVSMGALYVFYRWCRLFFGFLPSLLAVFLMSIGWWYLFYSLSPFQNMLVVFWEILAIYFLSKALKEGRKADYLWAGLFIGFCELEYLPGRLVVFMAGFALLGIWAVEGRAFWKNHAQYLALGILSMLWLAGPFIVYGIHNPSAIVSRAKELSLLAEVQRTGHYSLILKRFFWTFLSFLNHNEGIDPRFCANASQLDPVSGGLMVFGLLLALAHWRRRACWYALGGLFFGLVANTFAIQGPNPDPSFVNGQRYFVVFPFLFFMAAWTLDRVAGVFPDFNPAMKRTGKGLLALLVAFALIWNIYIYYFSFRNFKVEGPNYWDALGFNHIQVADYLRTQCPRCHALMEIEYSSSTVYVLTHDLFTFNRLGDYFPVPIRQKITKNVLFVIPPSEYPELQEKLRQTYPKAVWGSLKDPKDNVNVLTVEVPKEDIQAKQEGVSLEGALE